MRDFYDAIYLSPHLDDAALSCGGQIFAQTSAGQSVLVVTVMAGDAPPGLSSPIIEELHGRWQLPEETVARRRAEDRTACQILGTDWLHWPAPDCIYRTEPNSGEPLYPTWAAVIGGLHPLDEVLVQTVAAQLAELPEHGKLLAPLGIGSHADHLVVKRAAQLKRGKKLAFYEDYPYAANQSLAGNDNEWRLQVIPLSAAALAARFEAIAAYQSQLSSFFQDRADLERQVGDFVKRAGGERIWYPTAVTH